MIHHRSESRSGRLFSLCVYFALCLLALSFCSHVSGARMRTSKMRPTGSPRGGIEGLYRKASDSSVNLMQTAMATYAKKKQVRTGRMHDPPRLGFNNDCYKANIWGTFDRKGWSFCKRPGYYVNGMFRNSCNNLHCIEELWCCKQYLGDLLPASRFHKWRLYMRTRQRVVEIRIQQSMKMIEMINHQARTHKSQLREQAKRIKGHQNRLNSLEKFRHWSMKKWDNSDAQQSLDKKRLQKEERDTRTVTKLADRMNFLLQKSLEKETLASQKEVRVMSRNFRMMKWGTKKRLRAYTTRVYQQGKVADKLMKYKDVTHEFNVHTENVVREMSLKTDNTARDVASQISKFTEVSSTINKAAEMKKYMVMRQDDAKDMVKKQQERVDKLEVKTEDVSTSAESVEKAVRKEEKERVREFAGTKTELGRLTADERDLRNQIDNTFEHVTDIFKGGLKAKPAEIPEADYEQLQDTMTKQFAAMKRELFSQLAQVSHGQYDEKKDGYLQKIADLVKESVEEFVHAGGAQPLDVDKS